MATEKVRAKHTGTDRTGEVEYDFGANLAEMAKLFGEEVVYSNAKQAIRITLQARLRSAMEPDAENGKAISDKELQGVATNWKPGVATTTRKSPAEKAKEQLAKLSPEERKALLASLK